MNTDSPVQTDPDGATAAPGAWPPKRQCGSIGTAGLLIAAGAIVALEGAFGALVAVIVVAVALVTPTPVAFAVGVVGLTVGTGVDPIVHGIGILALFGVLVEPATGTPRGASIVAMTGVVAVALAAVTVAGHRTWSLLAAAALLTMAVAGAVYAIHRYVRVALGLVRDTEGST